MMNEIKHVLISSSAREPSESGNSYTITLETPVKGVYKAELLYASIPSLIIDTDGNNVITIINKNSVSNSFSIPAGFYGVKNIATAIQNAIKPITGINVSYIDPEGKFIFYNKTDSFTIHAMSSELKSIIGFNSGDHLSVSPPQWNGGTELVPLYSNNFAYETDTNAYKNWIKSDTIANALPEDLLFLDIPELRSPTAWAVPIKGSGSGMSPFAIIPVNHISGNYITYQKNSDFDFSIEYPNPIPRLDRITIRLLTPKNKLIDFNGLDDNYFILKLYTTKMDNRVNDTIKF